MVGPCLSGFFIHLLFPSGETILSSGPVDSTWQPVRSGIFEKPMLRFYGICHVRFELSESLTIFGGVDFMMHSHVDMVQILSGRKFMMLGSPHVLALL